MNRYFIFFLLAANSLLLAIDVDPGKKTVPENFYNSKGGFSIFSGDPERIQKENRIDYKNFEVKVSLNPATVSVSAPGAVLKVDFSVKNIGKKTYTLSYPDAQRYDVFIKDSTGKQVYQWSADKIFTQQIGTSLINSGDRIAFLPQVNLSDFDTPAKPGTYTVEVVLSNHPSLKASTTLTLTP